MLLCRAECEGRVVIAVRGLSGLRPVVSWDVSSAIPMRSGLVWMISASTYVTVHGSQVVHFRV